MLGITDDVYHYEAAGVKDRYIVWAEDSEPRSLGANNHKDGQTIQGTIDYFTKTDFDETVDKIQDALNEARISFRLNSVQYEDETGYQHYEWLWEV